VWGRRGTGGVSFIKIHFGNYRILMKIKIKKTLNSVNEKILRLYTYSHHNTKANLFLIL
jgi:mRNA-degrading endonuclease RelE of RelBE toxin-antitoxin system